MSGSVLIVHDDPNMRRWLGELLGSKGYRCLGASTGQEALAILEEDVPSLLVIGGGLPLMSGWKLIEALAHYPDLSRIPRLIVSAEAEPTLVCEQALALLQRKPKLPGADAAVAGGDVSPHRTASA